MIRIKYTPHAVLQMAEAAMPDWPEPFYCKRNAWSYKQWLDMRNQLADRIMVQS